MKEQGGEKKKRKKVVLLDTHAIIHRAYHALPDFSSSSGEPTGALYGLSAMLLKLVSELKPDYLIACFDLPDPTHRHQIFEAYKANRGKAEDDLVAQIIRSRDVLKAFGVPLYETPGFEADDVLGTIVDALQNEPVDVVVASGDMDTLQLVDEKRVQVFTLKKGIQDTIMYDEAAVRARFGFAPRQLPDYKGITGDPSDNIPGVAGVGDTTAQKLVSAYGDLEDVLKALDEDIDAVAKKTGVRSVYLSRVRENADEARFSKVLATIRRDAPINFSLPEHEWSLGDNQSTIQALFDELEFRTLGGRVQELIGTPKIVDTSEHPTHDDDPHMLTEASVALALIRPDFTESTTDDVLRFTHASTLDEARERLHVLLKERELVRVFEEIEQPLIPVVERLNETGIMLDTAYLKKISREYHTQLEKEEKQIYELVGHEVNINSPKQMGALLFDELGITTKGLKKTATGKRSTRESELLKLADAHPIIGHILAYRELQKLLSTYIDNLPAMVDTSSRLHTRFMQMGTTTGRISSRDPNLQNIPNATDAGRKVRKAFVAPKGRVLISLDYSQIELRVAAMVTGDENLTDAFRKGQDIHTAVASRVFSVAPDEVTKEQRRKAKVINFGILYGMGVNALRVALGKDTTTEEARTFYDAYFANHPTLARWIDETKAEVRRLGYTRTLFGRRRYFEGLDSHMPHIRAAAERMALNAPLQGTAADIIKRAMVDVDAFIEKEKLRDTVCMVLQVHDELVFEVEEAKAAKIAEHIKNLMENIMPEDMSNGIPLVVDAAVGKNWGELQNFKF